MVGFSPLHWSRGWMRAAVSSVLQLSSAFTLARASRNAGAAPPTQEPRFWLQGVVGPAGDNGKFHLRL